MEPATSLYRLTFQYATHPDWAANERVLALAGLFERLLVESTKQEQIAFSTLFARLCYVGHKHQFPAETLQAAHAFRRLAARIKSGRPADETSVKLGVKTLAETILMLYRMALPSDLLPLLPTTDEWQYQPPDIWDFKANALVVVLDDDPEAHCLTGYDEENPGQPIRIRYDLSDRNDNFKPTIRALRTAFQFPVTVNLVEVDIDRNGDYRPRAIVVEPDYLLDVSAISECFKDTGPEPLSFLVRKLLPQEQTLPIFLGNIVNYFLDRLLNEPTASYPELFKETFRIWPFTYAPLENTEVQSLYQSAQKHFVTLHQMANGGLEKEQIQAAHCILEPAFFSREYGIQGRLDLFYRTDERAAIVELKSGKPFKPNTYGITRSHFTQTLLYDLLVKSVYGRQPDPAKYILYSVQPEKPLCFAPTVESEQFEALNLRNQLLAIERLLCDIKPGQTDVPLLGRLTAANGAGKGFLERDFQKFDQFYSRLSVLEKKYINAFIGFIAREQWTAKVGEHDADAPNGFAALWRGSLAEKQSAFTILNDLEIAENCADQTDAHIVFNKTADTNPLANFRVGDIAVLYPAAETTDTVLRHQVIKCTITDLSTTQVRVQLRYRQFNKTPFDTTDRWRLEPDMLETGFNQMYAALFAFGSDYLRPSALTADQRRRMILEGVLPLPLPLRSEGFQPPRYGEGGQTQIQTQTLNKIIQSQHYFLLWGPPGTGKTSVMLRDLARWVLENTTDNLLLLAYTNRAVDEICEALDDIGGDIREQYLRIGSTFSTAERFRPQLLNQKIATAENRAALRQVLDHHRVFVSTVASFSQNGNLLKLKRFQRLVIDEASQLLEPQIIGLLPNFDHYVLIGDHKQLPAVTAQRPDFTLVNDPDLNAIGLTDLRMSYFERMYREAVRHGREANYGRLSEQGRMNEAIMAFPNERFYGGFLSVITPEQSVYNPDCVQFIHVPGDGLAQHSKTNAAEARTAAQLVRQYMQEWADAGRTWEPVKSLGIITPWRAQIAQIREALATEGINPDLVTVDTVERYQGGAREIILVSTCINAPYQLHALVNLSDEGVDRKLNVALTRARKRLVLLGNADLLKADDRYRAFIERYRL